MKARNKKLSVNLSEVKNRMNKQKFVYVLIGFIFLVVNSSVGLAFKTASAEPEKIKGEQIAKLIQQLELLSQETQSFNLFSNRVYFSVLTTLDLYSAAKLADEYNEKKKTENYKPVAESYKTYLYQVVNQQKAALDDALDAAISEHNKLTLQIKNADSENTDKAEAVVPDNAKNHFRSGGSQCEFTRSR